jgi:hypothetical protein
MNSNSYKTQKTNKLKKIEENSFQEQKEEEINYDKMEEKEKNMNVHYEGKSAILSDMEEEEGQIKEENELSRKNYKYQVNVIYKIHEMNNENEQKEENEDEGEAEIIYRYMRWKSAPIYSSSEIRKKTGIYYPDIIDNTEGIAGFSDLYFPSKKILLLDVGGGSSDVSKKWVECNYKNIRFLVVDPYKRSYEHNRKIETEVKLNGGADIITSMSVLNVIPDKVTRIQHILYVYQYLRYGGTAYFKIWPGFYPERGSGLGVFDFERKVFQSNCWVSFYVSEVASVFGNENIILEFSKNLLIANK